MKYKCSLTINLEKEPPDRKGLKVGLFILQHN